MLGIPTAGKAPSSLHLCRRRLHSPRHAVGATTREQRVARLTHPLPTCDGDVSEGCSRHHKRVCAEQALARRQERNSRHSVCLPTRRKGSGDGACSRTTAFGDSLQKESHQEEIIQQPV